MRRQSVLPKPTTQRSDMTLLVLALAGELVSHYDHGWVHLDITWMTLHRTTTETSYSTYSALHACIHVGWLDIIAYMYDCSALHHAHR